MFVKHLLLFSRKDTLSGSKFIQQIWLETIMQHQVHVLSVFDRISFKYDIGCLFFRHWQAWHKGRTTQYFFSLWWRWMYIIIDILIFRVSMNGKGYKFQLGIKFLNDLDKLFVIWLKRLLTSFVRDSNGHMVHFFQCQFLWIYDFVENLLHVSLLLKRYNLFDTIFLILFPVSILTYDAIVKSVISRTSE